MREDLTGTCLHGDSLLQDFHVHADCESPCKLNLHGDSVARVNHHVNMIYMVIHRSLPHVNAFYMLNQVTTHVKPFTRGNALATM